MSTPIETGPDPVVEPSEDPVMTPVTDVTVDDSGNTTVVGYPPSTNEVYTEQPGAVSPDGPGIGALPDGGGGWG